jgi:hypothetical protein
MGPYQPLVRQKLARSFDGAAQELSKNARRLWDIARSFPDAVWQDCSWTTGDGKRHHTGIAWQEIFLARGLKEPNGRLEKVWLVADWPKGLQSLSIVL